MSPRSSAARRILRYAAMVIIGLGSLLILKKLGYLDLDAVAAGFRREGYGIGLVVFCLAALLLLSAIRMFYLVRALSLRVSFREILAANLVGQAIGQWLPGSLALTEIFRFGLLAKLRSKGSDAQTGTGPIGRLGVAILVDRLLGLGAMFAVGGLAGLGIFFVQFRNVPGHGLSIGLLSAFSFILGLAALAAPFRPNRRLKNVALRKSGWDSGRVDEPGRPPAVTRSLVRRAAGKIVHVLEAVEQLRSGRNKPAVPLLLSLAAAMLNPLTLYFASRAAGSPLPFPVILAAIPFTVAAIFLPTGIAGYGGPQLLAAGVFALFGAEPATVVTACLLQNTIVLAGQTVGGAVGIALLSGRSPLRPGKRD